MGIGFPPFHAACDISVDLWEWQWLHGWNLMKFEEGVGKQCGTKLGFMQKYGLAFLLSLNQ
jgi:hypothetical protein